MTHKDIYIKFMIEYDKANVTSSYPSLTEYEVATFLDKAYQSIITQKVTGNVPRRAGLEMDLKAMEDLEPLIKQHQIADSEVQQHAIINNVKQVSIADSLHCLYFIDLYLNANVSGTISIASTETNILTATRSEFNSVTFTLNSSLLGGKSGVYYAIPKLNSIADISDYTDFVF